MSKGFGCERFMNPEFSCGGMGEYSSAAVRFAMGFDTGMLGTISGWVKASNGGIACLELGMPSMSIWCGSSCCCKVCMLWMIWRSTSGSVAFRMPRVRTSLKRSWASTAPSKVQSMPLLTQEWHGTPPAHLVFARWHDWQARLFRSVESVAAVWRAIWRCKTSLRE